MVYAIDTNVIVEILNRNKLVCSRLDGSLKRGDRLVVPVISDYEIWRGFYHKSTDPPYI
ncbi:MAG: hypothetical protein FWH05_02160 [Oscillospiraceae bacterium]|nr:hypothetical protein [Oscillospiraceae bacterium]